MSYADPHGLFSFLRRFRPQRGHGSVGVACSPRSLSFLLSSFRFLRSPRASEGLAPFRSRTLGRHLPRLGGREPHGREPGNPGVHGHRPEDQGKKTGRSIRCPARIRPLKKSPIRLEPLASGRAPALHACECLTMPVFEPYPFGFAMRGGSGRFLSGAFSAFHPAMDYY